MIRDRNIDWLRKKLFIPGSSFTAFVVTPDALGALTSVDAGAVVLQEISTFGYGAPLLDTAGDLVAHCMNVPYDMDPDAELGFTVVWTSGSATSADTIDWKVVCDFKAVDAAIIAPTTVLSTAIAQDTVGATTAYLAKRTSRGILNAGFLTRAQVAAGAVMMFSVEMDAFAAGLSEDKFLLGIEIDYKLRMTNS